MESFKIVEENNEIKKDCLLQPALVRSPTEDLLRQLMING
jgi:hypothetical protein